jgi:cell wall-associated NlpC family hydrolase
VGRLIGAVVALLITPVLLLSAAGAGIFGTDDDPATQPVASGNALADVPPAMLVLYQRAASAECDGLPWTVLAAIGKVESDHGRSTLPGVHSGQNEAGAMGPLQMLAATFAAYDHPTPPGGAVPASPYDPVDAVHAATRYLCASGARDGADIPAAVFAYNHSSDYQAQVLAIARGYAADAAPTDAADTASKAVAFARAQLGVPYVWGGNGSQLTELPDGRTRVAGGFDCSGLTRAAYATAGIDIPRTARAQFAAGPHIPTGQPLEPGDLIFYGHRAATVHHVGIYIGDGKMIHAPDVGDVVRVAPYRWPGDDLWGVTRPANQD